MRAVFFSFLAISVVSVQQVQAQSRQATATMRVTATVVHSCQVSSDDASVNLSCARANRVRPVVTAENIDGPVAIGTGETGRFFVLFDPAGAEVPESGPAADADTIARNRSVRVTVSF